MPSNYHNLHHTAIDMADKFEEFAIIFGGIHHITQDGYVALQDIYDKVLPEMRATVFNDFCKELTRRGIEYDVQDFDRE